MSTTSAESAAEQLLSTIGQKAAPINLEAAARHLDVNIYVEPMEAHVSGVLLCENNKRKIAVNEKHHLNRRRFTIAHELGHICLHVKGEDRIFVDQRFFRDTRSSKGIDKEEIEANAFAASFLMPKKLLTKSVEQLKDLTEHEVFRLALLYQVSEQAMALRLVKLGFMAPD